MKIRLYHGIMLPFILLVLLLSLTPVISRDALIHHMALPKLWLDWGMLSVDIFRDYAFYPSNLQVFYYLSLLCDLEYLPKIIHCSFLIMTGILIYRYLQESKINNYLVSISFILILTIPINQRLSSEVYVDLGLLFFSSLSILYFLKWKNSSFKIERYLIISSIGSGLALGTKYNGLIPFVIINLFVIFSYARYSQENIKSLMYGVKFLIIALILSSPWLVRNYLITGGNPFYPLFTSVFPDNININKTVDALESLILYRSASGESLLDIILIPIRIFLDGEDHDFLRFDGKLNPMMLILLPVSFIFATNLYKNQSEYQETKNSIDKNSISVMKNLSSDQKYLFFYFICVLIISMKSSIRIRYAIPIITPLIILNTFSISALIYSSKKFIKFIGYISIIFYISYNLLYTYDLFHELNLYKYVTFQETKNEYLKRELHLYKMYEYINNNTSKDAVIYDVLCGHRSYYVDREYIHDRNHVDTIFFDYAQQAKLPEAYSDYLRRLQTHRGSGATHLLIKPYLFVESYKNIFKTQLHTIAPHQDRGLLNFMKFLKQQKILYQSEGAVLYELVST